MIAKPRAFVGDEERRRKQRDLKRRYRERRKAMQQQVAQLEARYDALLNAQQQMAVTSRRAPSPLEQQYAAATNELNSLRRQIATTKQKLAEFDGFASSLEVYLTDFEAPSAITAAALASGAAKSSLLMAPSLPSLTPADSHPRLTEHECQEMIKQCYYEIFDRRYRGKCLSSGMHMLGWEDQMFLDGTTLQFSMSKRITGMSANTLMQKTWDIVTTEQHMRTIQYSTLGIKVLHKINDDTLVIQRCVHHPQLKTVNWNNMVMFRLRSPRGYVVAYQTIYHPAYAEGYTEYFTGHEDIVAEDLQPKFSRVNTLQWFLFEEDDNLDFDIDSGGSDLELLGSSDSEDSSSSAKKEVLRRGRRGLAPAQPQSTLQRSGGVKVSFAGKVDNRDPSYAHFYMFEVLTYIIRWENAVGSARLTF
ncbi:Abnormal spindle microcephaly-associated protein [Phytophthora cinnamomi]|uniref:Abnormal spindle microcephaly-associated protein n=1 Tax=Phytophthora cinnamomi TaxID=4785 RepID=UPI00355A022A|nr:Abnormal spindle microcephaly-associated protein [Phytophthora cinnamomi]